MKKLATISLALFGMLAPAAANVALAASAEDAIKGWVASVPAGGDWSVKYTSLAYDTASDKTTLKGLSIAYAKAPVTFVFDTIVIGGFNQASDGGFSVASFTADGGKATGEKVNATISGVAINDFGTGAMKPVSFDMDHPMTSLVAIYSQLLNIHLGHAGIDKVDFHSDLQNMQYAYSNMAIDNWKDGKIASMTFGGLDSRFDDPKSGPVHMTMGQIEARDADFDAIMSVVDPSRYKNGVGDQTWRTAERLIAYHDLSIESSDFDFKLGELRFDNFKVRQPKQSFTAALDTVFKIKPGDKDVPPELLAAIPSIYYSFGIEKLGVKDVSFNSGEGDGSLGAFTISDLSTDGIGEISADGFDVNYLGGFTKVGRIAAGGIVFPGLDQITAAIQAAARDEEPDLTKLTAKLGYIEAADVDFQTEWDPLESTCRHASLSIL